MLGQVTKATINDFSGALNNDLANSFQSEKQYIEGKNVSLIENNKFYSLTNLAGTTNVTDLLPSSIHGSEVLGVFNAHLSVGGNKHKSLIIFVTDYSTLKIFAYDTEASQLYEMFSQSVGADYNSPDRVVDAELYPENNIDYLYFTDNYHEYRKLKCEIPNPYIPGFLTSHDLKVIRPFPLGIIEMADIKLGGSLLCGSYQFAYQLYNPTKNKYTKFSLLTNPVQVFGAPGAYITDGGIGMLSPYQILLNISLSEHEKTLYTHFRLAVVENIYPNIEPVDAVLTNFYPIADYDSGNGNISSYAYAANIKGDKILIAELVVETSPIDTIKTLAVKENRLFAANVTYKDLDYDNGMPIFESGEILRKTGASADPFRDPVFATRYKGHFRNEVYRFAISYFDEDGNFSIPQVFDCSSIEANDYVTSIVTQNVITNSTFDAGLSGWSQLQYEIGDADWDSVSGHARFNMYAMADYAANSKILYQTLPSGVGPAGTLEVRWRYEPPMWMEESPFMQIFFLNNGTIVSHQTLGFSFGDVNSNAWFSKSITLPTGANQIGVRFYHSPDIDWSGGQPPYIMVDSITFVTSVPVSGGGSGGSNNFYLDMKFPDRSVPGYGLWSQDGKLQSLGVQFKGIVNHPSWARGFVILRAERLKDIVTQTPLIPMVPIHGVGAVQNYPIKALERTGTVEYPQASPMGPNTTYVPKNFMWPETRSIMKNISVDENNSNGLLRKYEGEARYGVHNATDFFTIFPPKQMYDPAQPFETLTGLTVKPVDAVALQMFISDLVGSPDADGNRVGTNVATTVFGLRSGDYFYDGGHVGTKTLSYAESKVKDYDFFDNFHDGRTFAGVDVFKYSNLNTQGVIFGGPSANTQRAGVLNVDKRLTELNHNSSDFASNPTFFTASPENDLPTTFATTSTGVAEKYIDVVPIVNIIRGLSDDRYGRSTDKQEYIFTGTMVVFNQAELSNIKAGIAVPKTVDVWGGDCVVSPHLFKITDTTYGVTNQAKFNANPGFNDSLSGNTLRAKWDKVFLDFGGNSVLSVPIAYDGCAQYIQVVLESEYNGSVRDSDFFRDLATLSDSGLTILGVDNDNAGHSRAPLTYQYNTNYVKENNEKKFYRDDIIIKKNRSLRSRIHVTDQKIYQSNIEGFDMFRILNYKDLEETYGGITKLITLNNSLYAIQDSALTYLTVGINVLEQADGETLSVKSNEVISNIIIRDNKHGSQHLRSVVNTGEAILFLDNLNKGIYIFGGDGPAARLSDNGLTSNMRELLGSNIAEREIIGVYNTDRDQYLIGRSNGDFCYSYLFPLKAWEADITFPANAFQGGVYANQKLYLVGHDSESNKIALHTYGTGAYTKLFGTFVTPSVKFIITPDAVLSKTFDSMVINSSDRLKTLDLLVTRELSLGPQLQVPTIDLSTVVTRNLGNYKIKTLRDETKARVRGLNAVATLTWDSGEDSPVVQLNSVITKYRSE